MVVITANLPVTYIKMIEGLVGNKGLYPSRSELIRMAVHDFLILTLIKLKTENEKFILPSKDQIIKELEYDSNKYVRIPTKYGSKLYKLIDRETKT